MYICTYIANGAKCNVFVIYFEDFLFTSCIMLLINIKSTHTQMLYLGNFRMFSYSLYSLYKYINRKYTNKENIIFYLPKHKRQTALRQQPPKDQPKPMKL